jgi:hypothetical protein
MAIKTFTSGEVLTAADTNTYLANSALQYIKTQTVTAGSSNTVITGCFPSTFNSFLFNFNMTATASSDAQIQFQVGGVTSVVNYSSAGYYLDITGSSNFPVNSVAAANFGAMGVSAALGVTGQLTVNNPNLARRTTFSSTYIRDDFVSAKFGAHTVATAYDAMVVTCGAGTFGGTITVYGYRIA